MTSASTETRPDRECHGRQAANLLGALALALSDRLEGATTEAALVAENDAVALAALHEFLDSPRVDLLAQVLGLTSSGTVRLLDRLEDAGLVRRSRTAGDDGRVTSVALTAAGRRRAQAVGRARMELLDEALRPLNAAERHQLGQLVGKILAGLVRPPGATRWTCRLCDLGACGRAEGRCPVFEAAKARYEV